MSVRSLALKLGVSATAVSLALKDSPRISLRLRGRVQRAAKAMGHIPNARLTELMTEVRRSRSPAFRATLGLISLYPEERPWAERPEYGHLKLVVDGARERAEALGYKLDNFWLTAPGITPRRLRFILEARGVRGLLCLGALNPEERFPEELTRFAVVTYAASIPGPLHRVVSNFAGDAGVACEQLLRRGYGRPGLIMLQSGDRRSGYLYSAVVLSNQERNFSAPGVPILRPGPWDEDQFVHWYDQHQPDVLIVHPHGPYLKEVERLLGRRGIAVPRDLGLLVLDRIPPRSPYSGILQNHRRMGQVAIEMLVGHLLLQDFGLPEHPRIELVGGAWVEGRTLRALPGGQ